ncbi:glycine-rich protein [Aeromicrobium sp. P5_D10]
MTLPFLVPTVARVTALALAASGLALVGASPTSAAPTTFPNTKHFEPAASTEWTVPPGVTSIDFVAIGGRGLRNATGVSGGLGVKLAGKMTVTPGQKLYVTTAGNGDTGGGGGQGAGYNGGAAGGNFGSLNGRGGGASDIRFAGNELTDRKLVAGGGGGAYPGQNEGKGGGGDAGLAGEGQSGKPGDTGYCTNTATVAHGGSQTAGGAGGDAVANVCIPGNMLNGGVGSSGVLGAGGTGKIAVSGSSGGAGGGGGYYGGGGGASQAGGGGGSSYVDTSVFTLTTNEVTTEGPGVSFTYETLPGSLSVGDGYFDIAVGGPSYVLLWMELRDQADTPISGQDFTFSSTNPAVTFTEFTKGSGHYSVKVMAGPTANVGPVTVTAHAAGLSDSTTFNITKGTRKVAITSSPPGNPLAGGSYQVAASGGTPQTPIKFTTGSSRCTVSDPRNGSARVTFKNVGACVITAARGTDPNLFDTPPVSQTVTAYRGPQGTLAFAAKAKKPVVGGKYQARTKGSPSGMRAKFTTLTSSCRVDAKGLVKFRKAGTCVLTATQTGNADYYPSNTAIQVINVKKKPKKKRR